jgi:antirestriction protein ArdC
MPNAPEIEHGGSKAFYSSLTDRITLPNPEFFTSAEEYYAMAFHELITAQAISSDSLANRFSKLCRSVHPFTAVRSLSASWELFLGAEAGISPAVICNQTAYIAGWLKRLSDDRRLMIHAATHAQRAADFVLGRIPIEV